MYKWESSERKMNIKLKEFLNSKEKGWSEDFYAKPGIYAIIKNGRIIYIGKTNNFERRFKTDMLRSGFKKSVKKIVFGHTISNKLFEEMKNRKSVMNFIKSCSFKMLIVENERMRGLLEHFFIAVINPRYND